MCLRDRKADLALALFSLCQGPGCGAKSRSKGVSIRSHRNLGSGRRTVNGVGASPREDGALRQMRAGPTWTPLQGQVQEAAPRVFRTGLLRSVRRPRHPRRVELMIPFTPLSIAARPASCFAPTVSSAPAVPRRLRADGASGRGPLPAFGLVGARGCQYSSCSRK